MLLRTILGIKILIFIVCFSVTTHCVYPVPGSYYSILLRYNSRGKNRKEARIGPSPLRLWAYFDPPAALGSLSFDSIHDTMDTLNRKRITQGRLQKTDDAEKEKKESLENEYLETAARLGIKEKLMGQIKTNMASIPSIYHVEEEKIVKYIPNKNVTVNHLPGTCGSNERITLDPLNYHPDSRGRFFFKIIETIGFPYFYDPRNKCSWTFQIDDEMCRMGIIVAEILEGTLRESPRCNLDSITILFNGVSKERVCGSIGGTVTSMNWGSAIKQLVEITIESKSRDIKYSPDRKWGAKIAISGYCLVYSPKFLQKSIKGV